MTEIMELEEESAIYILPEDHPYVLYFKKHPPRITEWRTKTEFRIKWRQFDGQVCDHIIDGREHAEAFANAISNHFRMIFDGELGGASMEELTAYWADMLFCDGKQWGRS